MSIDIEPIEAFLHWRNLQSMNDKDLSPQAYARWLYDQENEEKLAELRGLNIPDILQDARDANNTSDSYVLLKDALWKVLGIVG